ncbi:MAG: efflux RND transporter permease subunit [Myxococcaceae bacterium]|nr:efflux RND transporter permease subunit [Myxococcaceae bacterium]
MRRPVFATVLSLVILVVGGVFYTQLGVDQFPKVDLPAVVVMTTQPGSSPEDIEREITDKIEGAVNTISGIDELRSNSSEGVSQVVIMFQLEKDPDVATQEVQQKVNSVLPQLPKGIDPPMVQKFDPDAAPILYVALNAKAAGSDGEVDGVRKQVDIREITDLADRVVRRRLESVSGVGQVTLIGGRRRQINVLVDPVKLRSLNMSAGEVAAAINAQNITLPGGRVDTSREYLSLEVQGRVESVDALKDIIVREQNGRAIRLSEIATVEDGVEDFDTSAMWNDDRTVLLAIRKQSGTNTVAVVDAVKERMAEVQKELPPGYSLVVQRDGSEVIRTGTHAVTEHLVLGALFAAIIVLLFLGNVRSTVIAALAIPTSIVGTFAAMKLAGYTLNSITLLALALAVGIVIDDAIVVLENIFKHIDEKGLDPKEAAIAGTREIGTAVMATTLSLIAVFLPIAFVAGIPGRFLASFGITMSMSIAVSLWVSFTLTPMLAAHWLKKKKAGDHRKSILERIVDLGYRPVERGYVKLLGLAMRHRWAVVVLSVLALVSMGPLAAKARKGFLPIDDRAQFEVIIRLPEGRSVAATELVGQRVARTIRAYPEVIGTLLTVGDDPAKTPNQARIYVKMVPPDQRKISQNEFKDVIRQQIIPTLPKDWRVNVADVSEFGGGQATQRIQMLLAGPDLERLTEANEHILERIRKIPDVVDVDSSLVTGKPELSVVIDRDRAADLGVQVMDIAQALQFLVAGQKVSNYSEGGEQYDIRIRATEEYRTNEDMLQLLTVPSRKVGLVSLADVVKVVHTSSPTTINRYMRERQVTFMANGKPGANEGAIAEALTKAIEDEHLPEGFSIKPQGTTKLMKETGLSFILGLLASMVFMYLILAAQFESWLHPVTILISLPLTLPFAILSIIVFDQALDLYSFLGIFVLFGVIKKNAILQIDHTNGLREKYDPMLRAALHGIDLSAPFATLIPQLEVALEGLLDRKGLEHAFRRKRDEGRADRVRECLEKAVRTRAILHANRDRLRPILMTTFAFVAGMVPLVTAKGVGSGFNKATAGVVVGGQLFSLLLTLLAVPVAYSYFDDISRVFWRIWRRLFPKDEEQPEPVPALDHVLPTPAIARGSEAAE